MLTHHALFGRTAGIVTFVAFIPYVIQMLRGRNRPNRATWIIWTVVGFNFLVTYHDLGATDALWVTIGNLSAFFIVMLLSFRYGEGGWTLFDKACLAGAGLGMLVWWHFHSSLLALWISIVVDFLGALPTLWKSYKDPESEDFLSWTLFLTANTLNLFAVDQWNFSQSPYPVYFFFISALEVSILSRRHF
nr:hypothetical protein [Deltaproteobacteria bacterium]